MSQTWGLFLVLTTRLFGDPGVWGPISGPERRPKMGWFYMVVCMGHHTNYSLAKTFGTVFRAG